MDVIITYDIKTNHTEIKDELKQLGYKDQIDGFRISDGAPVKQQLPNTTLIKYGVTSAFACRQEVEKVISKHNGGLDVIFCAELAVKFDWSAH